MNWLQFQHTIADWVADVTGLQVRWDPSKVERPPYPYVELSILSDVARGQDEPSYELVSGVLQTTIKGLRQVVVTVKVSSNEHAPDKHARFYTSKVVDALADSETIDVLSASDIAIVDASPVLSFNATRNLGIVSIAAFDLRLETLISRVTPATSYVAQAQIEGEIKTPTATIEFGPDTYGDL